MLDADEGLTNGQLAYAVRTVARGRVFYGPAIQSAMAGHLVLAGTPAAEAIYLTERELEIARLVARGLRRDIPRILFISDNTVRAHLQSARKKLGLKGNRDHRELRRRLQHLNLFDDDTMT